MTDLVAALVAAENSDDYEEEVKKLDFELVCDLETYMESHATFKSLKDKDFFALSDAIMKFIRGARAGTPQMPIRRPPLAPEVLASDPIPPIISQAAERRINERLSNISQRIPRAYRGVDWWQIYRATLPVTPDVPE